MQRPSDEWNGGSLKYCGFSYQQSRYLHLVLLLEMVQAFSKIMVRSSCFDEVIFRFQLLLCILQNLSMLFRIWFFDSWQSCA